MLKGDADRIRQDFGYLQSAAEKMDEMLGEILELLRMGRVVNTPVCVTFRKLVDEAIAAVAGQIAQKKVSVQVDAIDVHLYGDRLRLANIWQNLIDNAIKHMGDQVAPRVEVGAEVHDGETIFFVRDNGMGIDLRYKEKVFGLFEKLDPNSEGFGLGLALVKRIVEMYNGSMWLESESPGKGICFRFTLPGALKQQDKGKKT
jgi:signal transduction histidine kinase